MNRPSFAMSVMLMVMGAAVPALAQTAGQEPPTITTQGQATIVVAPDIAWVSVAAESRAAKPADAQQQNAAAIDAVRGALKRLGFAEDVVSTRGYSLQPQVQYADGKSKVVGYSARQSLDVRVDDLTKLGAVIDAAGGAGATTVSGIRYDVKNRAAVELQALTRAVKDGMTRVEAMASGAGRKVSHVLRIEEQRAYSGPRPMYAGVAAKMAEDVPTTITPGDIEVQATVTLTVVIGGAAG